MPWTTISGARRLGLALTGWLLFSGLSFVSASEPIVLPKPRMEGGKPLLQTLKERKSIREFSRQEIPRQLLADLLWAGFGVNRPENDHRTAPSTMNSQEIDLYVALADGTYCYDAKANQLRPVLAADIRARTGSQDFVKEAPVALLFVADLSRLAKAKPGDRDRYANIDTGYISQNIYLFCASEGLATVVHELDGRGLTKTLGLRPEQKVVLAQSVGFPKQTAGNPGGVP